jgi:hypothetical protein
VPFGTGTVWTNKGKAMAADRIRTTPATYTNPPKWLAIGTGATGAGRTAAVADTALTTEVETRAAGTESVVTTTVTGDTYQTQGTIAITATRALDEAGTFDQLAAGGNMGLSATYAVINLVNGDSIQLTAKTQFT